MVLLLGLSLIVLRFLETLLGQEGPEPAETIQPVSDAEWLAGKLAERVVVHTKDGHSIRGNLREASAAGVLLSQPQLLGEGLPEAIEGEVPIPAHNISFVQRLAVSE